MFFHLKNVFQTVFFFHSKQIRHNSGNLNSSLIFPNRNSELIPYRKNLRIFIYLSIHLSILRETINQVFNVSSREMTWKQSLGELDFLNIHDNENPPFFW